MDKEDWKIRDQHQHEMEAMHGLSDHPKAALLYDIAAELGESDGFDSIASWYNMLAPLLYT